MLSFLYAAHLIFFVFRNFFKSSISCLIEVVASFLVFQKLGNVSAGVSTSGSFCRHYYFNFILVRIIEFAKIEIANKKSFFNSKYLMNWHLQGNWKCYMYTAAIVANGYSKIVAHEDIIHESETTVHVHSMWRPLPLK